jgi:outer membrane protein
MESKQNSIGLILGGVSLIGVIVLFIMNFSSGHEQDSEESVSVQPKIVSSGSGTIAFIDSDRILKEYKLVPKLQKELEADSKRKDVSFSTRQKEYEEGAAYFQQQVANNAISEQSAQQIYEQLMAEQQALYQLQEQYSNELAQKEMEINLVILDSIRNYLGRINSSANLDYVLSYNQMSVILFAKDTFDITNQVVEGLNAEYQQKYPPAIPKKK